MVLSPATNQLSGLDMGEAAPAFADTSTEDSRTRSPLHLYAERMREPQCSTTAATSPSQPADKKNRRSGILFDAVRDFSGLKRPSAEDINKLKALFYEFIETMEPPQRRLVTAMLARCVYTPRAIALYLAMDDPQVAAPMLLFSPVLNELDLASISRKLGTGHAAIIRKRMQPVRSSSAPQEAYPGPTIPENPEKIETTSGSSDLVATAAQRDDIAQPAVSNAAKPGSNTKTLSGEEIVALAASGGRLGKRTAKQHPVNQAQRQPEAGRFSFFEEITSYRPRATKADHPARDDHGSSQQGFRSTTISVLDRKTTRQLLSLARHRNLLAIARLIETLCGLPEKATLKLMAAETGDEFLYLVRAIGIPEPHGIQFSLMALPRIGRGFESYTAAKQTLRELDQGICQMIFNEIGARFHIEKRPSTSSTETAPSTDQLENTNDTQERSRSAEHGGARLQDAIRKRRSGLSTPDYGNGQIKHPDGSLEVRRHSLLRTGNE